MTSNCIIILVTAFLIASASTQTLKGAPSGKDSPSSAHALSFHEDEDTAQERGKRATLGMFPRVGRDREDIKSRVERAAGLHVFPRIGRSPAARFQDYSSLFSRILRKPGLGTFPRIGRGGLAMFPRVGRGGLAMFPRVGRGGLAMFPRVGKGGLAMFPRLGRGPSSLGIFPRVGRDPNMQRDERALSNFPRIGRSGENDLESTSNENTLSEQDTAEENEEQGGEELESLFSTGLFNPQLNEEEDESWFDEPLPVVHTATEVKQADKRAGGNNDEDALWFGPRLGRKRRDVRLHKKNKQNADAEARQHEVVPT